MCSGYPDDEEISQLMSAKRRPWSGRGEQQMPEQMLQATKWWDRQPWMLTHHQLGGDQGEVTHGKKQQHGTAALYASCNRCMALTSWLWESGRKCYFHIIFSSLSLAEYISERRREFEPVTQWRPESPFALLFAICCFLIQQKVQCLPMSSSSGN